MITMASTFLAAIKAAVVPLAGPILRWLAPLAIWMPGVSRISRLLRVGSYIGLLALGTWGGVHINRWWTGDMVTQAEADAQARISAEVALERARLTGERAQIAEQKKALAAQADAVAERERRVDQVSIQQQQFEEALEAERNASNHNDGVAVIDADDPWLRGWQRRGR